MAVAYYGSHISEHLVKTPEGYLICYDVPINRTGTQMYTAGELGLEGEPERPVTVYRLEEDVFSPAALASLEGKDITRGHPAEMLAAENQASYSKGHLEHVRRDGDNTVADLIIKDPGLASDVESGVLREVSCGYYCRFEPYLDGYRQTNLVGNHVAVVPRGRAGHSVAIKDHAAGKAEKGLKRMKKETKEALYRFFGLAANDAAPEELEQLTRDVSTVATALDADPAAKAPEAEPAGDAAQASDEMVERAPKGDDIGSKLDRILEMLEAKARGGRGERPLHDEEDLDDLIEKLAGEGEGGHYPRRRNGGPVDGARYTGCGCGPAQEGAPRCGGHPEPGRARPRGGCAALHHPGSRCDERDCSGRPGQRTEGRRHGQAHQL